MMYDNAKTEKMIQSTINATVSHEIRNPINAIYSQNIFIEMLFKKVADLIEYLVNKSLSLDQFLIKLKGILKEGEESLSISKRSERLVSFLVEDYTDMGLVQMGKFRRADTNFEVQEPFEEVLSILKVQANHKKIEIKLNFVDMEPTQLIRCD